MTSPFLNPSATVRSDLAPRRDADAAGTRLHAKTERDDELKSTFQEFVAGTFYREMLGSMRKGLGKPAYFHGGHAEEVFQAEMDRHITDDLAKRYGSTFSEPLYDNFADHVLGAGRL